MKLFFVSSYLFSCIGCGTHKRNNFGPGFMFGLMCVLFFTERFFDEFLKEVQVDFEKGNLLNNGQWLSIPFILVDDLVASHLHEPAQVVVTAGDAHPEARVDVPWLAKEDPHILAAPVVPKYRDACGVDVPAGSRPGVWLQLEEAPNQFNALAVEVDVAVGDDVDRVVVAQVEEFIEERMAGRVCLAVEQAILLRPAGL